jgi:hypothetical protein
MDKKIRSHSYHRAPSGSDVPSMGLHVMLPRPVYDWLIRASASMKRSKSDLVEEALLEALPVECQVEGK